MPSHVAITITDIHGVVYESDQIDIKQFIVGTHSNTKMTEQQQMDYIKSKLREIYSFASDRQEISICENGVEIFFNPSHVISIKFTFS